MTCRNIAVFAILLSCSTAATNASALEKYVVVKITDFDKTSTYEAIAWDEYKELGATIKRETRLFSKAVKAAKKEWSDNEFTKRITFPTSAVSPRKVQVMGSPYRDAGLAQEKVTRYEDREIRSEERREERENEKEKLRYTGQDAKARRDKKRRRELERESRRQEAAEIFNSKMQELYEAAEAAAARKAAEAAAAR